MLIPLKNQRGIALILELIILGLMLAVIGSAGVAYSTKHQILSPSAKLLSQPVYDLQPSKPNDQYFDTKGCCPSSEQFDYKGLSQLQSFETRLEQHGWQGNQDENYVPLSRNEVSKEYIKTINGTAVCLNIGKSDQYDNDISLFVYFTGCTDRKRAFEDIFSGWAIYSPDKVPARYNAENYSIEDKSVILRFSQVPVQANNGSNIDIDESKLTNSFNPPSNCPVLSISESNLPCTLYYITPAGHKVYISNEYNFTPAYLSLALNNTVLTIRLWDKNSPEQALSKIELGNLVDSMKTITRDDLKSRLPKI